MLLCLTIVLLSARSSSLPLAAQAAGVASEEKSVAAQIAPGVVYRHLSRNTSAGEPWSIHVLEVDRNEKSVAVRTVEGHGYLDEMQRELPSEMGARAARAGVEVLGVVNGDYDLGGQYLGIPMGLSVTSGRLWTSDRPEWPVFGLLRSGEPAIGLAEVRMELSAGGETWKIAALNKPLSATASQEPQLFTREYRDTIKSDRLFSAMVIKSARPALPLQVDSTVHGVVSAIYEHAKEAQIPPKALVLVVPETPAAASASATSTVGGEGSACCSRIPLRRGQHVTLSIQVRLNGGSVTDIIGGGPVLVENGRSKFAGTHEHPRYRHPRTAVCYNEGKIIFTVVDGRQRGLSVGMTSEEEADLMASLGCTAAMNTDGGGSSVMIVSLPSSALPPQASHTSSANQAALDSSRQPVRAQTRDSSLQIVNSPSDGKERGRCNAWLIIRKP